MPALHHVEVTYDVLQNYADDEQPIEVDARNNRAFLRCGNTVFSAPLTPVEAQVLGAEYDRTEGGAA